MPRKVTEATLKQLLPTMNVVPDRLVSLTESFLARSLSLMPLKKTEEAARLFLCAHIACEQYRYPELLKLRL